MKRFVIGDIHGRYSALVEVLKKSKFDYENDLLILLGDIADGSSQVDKCVDELLKIKHSVFVIGNHDIWFINWYLNLSNEERKELFDNRFKMKKAEKYANGYETYKELIWTSQGGWNTIKSYTNNNPDKHRDFWMSFVPYYELEDLNSKEKMLFVHGGVTKKIANKIIDISNNVINKNELTNDEIFYSNESIVWYRDMKRDSAYSGKYYLCNWKHIFCGHTPTISGYPETYENVTYMDCGAGWDGYLCIMNIDTREYWRSKRQRPCM